MPTKKATPKKAAKKKPAAKKLKLSDIYDEKTNSIKWENIPSGTPVTGSICGREFDKGAISKKVSDPGAVYLCQNERHGTPIKNKYGFLASWYISTSSSIEHLFADSNEVRIFSIGKINLPDPGFKNFPINADYDAKIIHGEIIVGCQHISNATVRELVKLLID